MSDFSFAEWGECFHLMSVGNGSAFGWNGRVGSILMDLRSLREAGPEDQEASSL